MPWLLVWLKVGPGSVNEPHELWWPIETDTLAVNFLKLSKTTVVFALCLSPSLQYQNKVKNKQTELSTLEMSFCQFSG